MTSNPSVPTPAAVPPSSASVVMLAADQPGYPADAPFLVVVTASDADSSTETLPAGPDAIGDTVVITIARIDALHVTDIRWRDMQVPADTFTLTVINGPPGTDVPEVWHLTGAARYGRGPLQVTVRDSQGHDTVATIDLHVLAPPAPSAGTLFGAAVNSYPVVAPAKPHTRTEEYAALVAACGKPGALRAYLPQAQSALGVFPRMWAAVSALPAGYKGSLVWSYKGDLAAMARGEYDEPLTALLGDFPIVMPDGSIIYVACWHEIEDDIEARYASVLKSSGGDKAAAAAAAAQLLADWQGAQARLIHIIAQLASPQVHPIAILQGYTWDPASGRDPEDYFVPGMPTYGADTYDRPSGKHDGSAPLTAAHMMDPMVDWCLAHGVRAAWTEAGRAPDFAHPELRGQLYRDDCAYAQRRELVIMSYFDQTGPWADWCARAIVQRTRYAPNSLGAVTSIVPDVAMTAALRDAFALNG